MPKTLVICIDGTWNAPNQTDKDPVTQEESTTKSNVIKTWEGITQQKLNASRPYGTIAKLAAIDGEAMYLNGVGSRGSQKKRDFDGSTGTGTAERIIDAYRFIAERWEEGDKIFAFGFSRGAFAVRSAMGFLNHVGLPLTRAITKIDDIYDLFTCYRENTAAPDWTHKNAKVDFIGVWDTVGALAFGESLNNYHQLSPSNTLCVRQALALDEIRKQFVPEYWNHNGNVDCREVWFSGAHSNIGGGYVDDDLSDIALFWMLQHAKEKGLDTDLTQVEGWDTALPLGQIRNSYNEFWENIGIGKLIMGLHLEQKIRTILPDQFIHQSVFVASEKNYKPHATFADGSSALTGNKENWLLKSD